MSELPPTTRSPGLHGGLVGGIALALLDISALALAAATGHIPPCYPPSEGIGALAGCFVGDALQSLFTITLVYVCITATVVFVIGLLRNVARDTSRTMAGLATDITFLSVAIEVMVVLAAIAIAIIFPTRRPTLPCVRCPELPTWPLPWNFVQLVLLIVLVFAELIFLGRLLVALAFGALGGWLGRGLTRPARL